MGVKLTWLLGLFLLLACAEPPPITPTPTQLPTPTNTPEIGVDFATLAPPTAQIVEITPTPLPTATATPTPTPLVYAVQEGDTIWSIAFTNATIPDAVLLLNPDVRPELLQIGQELILPPPATPIFTDELGTPIPTALRVTSLQLVETPVGSWWVLGEVLNEGVFAAENVQLAINIHDTDEAIVATTSAWALPSIVPAGATAPFSVLIRELPTEPSNVTTSIVGGNTLVDLGSRYLDVAIEATASTFTENRATIEGVVENVGDLPTEAIFVVATFYDSNGNVVGIGQQVIEETLESAETIPFTLTAVTPGGNSAEVALAVQALLSNNDDPE